MDLALREKVFQLLEEKIAPKVNKRSGRPGMTLWRILVCGVVRLDLNEDYDRLHELVNHHDTIRQILGHGECDVTPYQFQTLKDNVALLTPELLDEINQIVVNAGHVLIKKRKAKRCVGAATPSWLRRMSTFPPTSIYYLTRCARWCRWRLIGVTGMVS